jgi:hypothetical protein
LKTVIRGIIQNWKRIVALIALQSFLIANSPAALMATTDTKSIHKQKDVIIKVVSSHSDIAEPTTDTIIISGDVRLEIPAGAVDIPTKITVQELSNVEALNQGMYNITAGAKGYRFLPHGIQFSTDIKITIPYDTDKLTDESDLINLFTYFYNEEYGYWERLVKESINEEAGAITSLSNHFTDMITSTLKLPESPKPLSFNPNSIKDIKAANPASNIQQIRGLEPNTFGSANFSLPLTIPPGRNGVQPHLALEYNSNVPNGWLGTGFDITVPSITIDTKFGLPAYDGTDTYLLNGQELIAVEENGSEVRYKSRVEGGFARIIRKGTSADNWWWEITSKDGTRQVYGTDDAILQSYRGSNPINKWFLKRVIDTNGNMVIYTYSTDTESNNAEPSRHTYLSGIEYTAHTSGLAGKYFVEFVNEDRSDVQVDCRGKFKSALRQRLAEINVQYDSTTFRRYKLTYVDNAFGKSQCSRFTEYAVEQTFGGEVEHEFYGYDFTFFDMPTLSEDDDLQKYGSGTVGDIKGFSETVAWDTGLHQSMNETHTIGGGGGAYVGVGFTGMFNTSIGGNVGFQLDFSFDRVNFMDINGDSLPDIVYYAYPGSPLYAQLNTGDGFETTAETVTNFSGLLNSTIQPSFSFGMSASAGPASASLGGSFAFSNALSTWADINGDGFIDYIPMPYSPNFLKGSNDFGEIRFDGTGWKASTNTINPDDIPDIGIGDIDEMEDLNSGFHLLDPVRKWQPYKNGTVRITGTIEKQDNGTDVSDGVKVNLYKNNTSVWNNVSNDSYWNDVIDNPTELNQSVYLKEGLPIRSTKYDHDDLVSVSIAEDADQTDDIYFKVNAIDGIENDVIAWNPKIVYTEIQYLEDMEGMYDYNGKLYPVQYDGDNPFIQVYYTTSVTNNVYTNQSSNTVGAVTELGILADVNQVTGTKKCIQVQGQVVKLTTLQGSTYTSVIANTGNGVTAQINGDVVTVIEDAGGNIKTYILTNSPSDDLPVKVAVSVFEDILIAGLLPDNTNDIDLLNTCYTKAYPFYDVTKDAISSADRARLNTLFKNAGIVLYDTLEKKLNVYESAMYPVTEIEYTQALADNGYVPITEDTVVASQYENNNTSGTTSYIVLEDFDANGRTIGTRQYIHVFEPLKDFTLVDILAGADNPSNPTPPATTNPEDVKEAVANSNRHTSGGIYNWSYFEWNGDIPWDETKIGVLPEGDQNYFYSQAMETMTADYIYEDPTADLSLDNPYHIDMFRGMETRFTERVMNESGQMEEEEKLFIPYISYDTMCPTRKGGNSTDSIPTGSSSEISLGGIGDIRNSFNLSFNAGAGVGQGSLNFNLGTNKCYRDLFDINGDRYPDEIIYPLGSYELCALLNKDGGGFNSTQHMPGGFADLRVINNQILGLGISPGSTGSIIKVMEDASGFTTLGVPDKPAFNWGGSMNGSLGQTVTEIDMIDVNGDGLPDHIRKVPGNTYQVRLNLGDRFAAEEPWANAEWLDAVLQNPFTNNFDPALATGLNPINPNYLRYANTISGGASISVGIDRAGVNGGMNITGNRTKADLIDMNGDGLIDQVYKLHQNDYFYIKFNTGDGFTEPVKWYRPDWEINHDGFMIDNYVLNVIDEMMQTLFNTNGSLDDIHLSDFVGFSGIDSVLGDYTNDIDLFGAGDVISFDGGMSFQVGFNFTIEIGPMGPVPISVFITPSGNIAYSISSAQLSLRDIDGDGLPDHVFNYAVDDFFRVKLNTAGMVGLLKEIHTPLGGTIELDYEKTPNTVSMPNAQYVLNSVTKSDGIEDSYTTQYKYNDGYYDRDERQFYGFGLVTSINPDDSYTMDYYHNQDFYRKGLLFKKEVHDANGHKYTEEVNTYVPDSVDSGIYVSKPVVFPKLTETNTYFYDTVNQYEYIQTCMTYPLYNEYGDITYAIDKGDVTNSNDDIHIYIRYDKHPSTYIVSTPAELKVTDSSGKILRQRWGEFDEYGNLERLEQNYKDGENPMFPVPI